MPVQSTRSTSRHEESEVGNGLVNVACHIAFPRITAGAGRISHCILHAAGSSLEWKQTKTFREPVS